MQWRGEGGAAQGERGEATAPMAIDQRPYARRPACNKEDEDRARVLYADGEKLLEERAYAQAIEKLEAAVKVVHGPPLHCQSFRLGYRLDIQHLDIQHWHLASS